MRRVSFALVAAVSAIALTQIASAADLPRKAPPYRPSPAPPPVYYSWTGFYAGLNAGYHWSNSSVDTVGTPGPFYAPDTFDPSSDFAAQLATTSLKAKNNGFIGGGQIGYNWQFSPNWVAGLEADIQGLAHHNGTDSITSGPTVLPPCCGFVFTDTFVSTTSVEKRVDWLGTARARLGFLATPSLLVYGTGGLAYGEVKASTAISQTVTCVYGCPGFTVNYGSTGSFSETRAGWTVGGGLEWMFAPHWTVKAEYLYYDLGKETFALPDLVATVPGHCAGSTCWSAHAQSTTRFNGNIARVGINYLFN
jgi:outer membrane immunogenic protein